MIILYESVIRAVVINQHLVPSRNYGKLAGNHPPPVFGSGNIRDERLGSYIVFLSKKMTCIISGSITGAWTLGL